MKRILVPCDFSQVSREAYKTAMSWAALTKGEVIVLYVIFIPAVYEVGLGGETMAFNPEYLTTMERDAKNEFQKMKQSMRQSPVKSKLEIIYGDVVFSIKEYVATRKMDMVIMGTSGSSGMAEIFIGSTTEKVVRHSTVPVLAVRKFTKPASIKKILMPTLLNEPQADFMNKLNTLQHFLKAKLHILFINSPGYFLHDAEAKQRFDDFIKRYKLKNCEFHFRNYRNEEEGILDFASREKMDLIAMATHARKGLAHLFNGSITEDIVNHVTCPVWTYAIKKRSA